MSIYKQLLEVQREVGAISKDSKNPFFKSKYFDINKLIEVVNPVLSKHGLVLLQPILEGRVYSKIIDAETGETLESYLELPNLPKPQDLGSCVSYYRRYTLASLMGLQATDEDGNGLKAKPKPKAPEKLTDERFKDAMEKLKNKTVTKAIILAFDLTEEQKQQVNK